ncbi:uncharacterized protein HMPREF1541_08915 [Cyphellophora europaea CBS 101466]|uniref:Uncharacterized protein n=1 Tax=Cyphellophora europaea (strain CBS 101466) TaxID=1220924 RepID=W2RJG7_CYPE1|nr:uncharacterized protein HMPREF1541_08915 [Cyphellophora europaea CBS 101466]ETN36637.1 hypothetical protein HMPREF1541_08915 [Cyphellophora europaea CBS 101466]
MAAPRLLKTKDFADDTYQEPTSKRNKKSSKYTATVQQAKRRRKAASPSSSESSDSLDGDDASDEQSEDDDDADDLPAVVAPSRHNMMGGTGRFYDGVPRAGSVESMFGEKGIDLEKQDLPTLEDMRRYEEHLFANVSDDDDAAYAAVEDISDSDEEEINHFEEQQLIADLSEDDELEELDLLNQIDGMSAYGFGDESDATATYPPSSQGSDSASEMGPTRHVHFNVDPAHAFNPSLVDSPTFSRALLPSALPDSGSMGLVGHERAGDESSSEGNGDNYDSDATDDCLPPEAQLQDDDEEEIERPHSPPTPGTAAKQKAECKGPPRGIFIDEGTKTTGILDKTGKIMIITHPHLLGDEFARRYGNSTASSPAVGFEDLLSESDFAEDPNYSNITPASEMDMMLNNGNSIDVNGIVTGTQEAFYPPGFNLGDFAEDFELDLDVGDDLGEDVIKLDDVIQFDDESDDSEAPTSPFFMTPRAPAQNHIFAPSASTVTAFRRHQDSFKTTPSFSRFSELSSPASAINPRKRKSTIESPYASEHYKGVTPVQRMTNSGNTMPSTPDTVRPKRQRLMMA